MLFSSSTKTKKNYIIFCCTDAFVSKERVKRIVLQILKRSDRQDPWSDVFVKPNPKLWRFGLLIGVLAPKRKKIIYLLLNRCVCLQRKCETHCFTATKAIGPTSPVFRCFCEAESEIVVFRVADRCSSSKTQKIIYLLLYKCISCVIGFCRNGLLYLLLCNLFLFQICERRSQFRSICIL